MLVKMAKLFLLLAFLILISSCKKKESAGENNTGAFRKDDAVDTASDKSTDEPVRDKKILINKNDLVGKWVEIDNKMAFELISMYKAASIYKDTINYNSWKVNGDTLVLNITIKGASKPVTSDEMYLIKEADPGTLILAPLKSLQERWTFARTK